jgi:hypothetical protein
MASRLYLAYFDSIGFECVFDLTELDKKAMWATLAEKESERLPIHQMIMRAKFNPQRFPEIWTFHSELDIEEILRYTRDMPQAMADAIRNNGEAVFVTKREKEVIK